ncbi:TonB-dependent hemoglobin/transferrin/lactoferrin family receptor [Erwinia pyrifoliae]|uniref:TonB-dependent hemoglobin/transferrin/lactoferrin family receptor n=1 Tax=Erwinia pyrifoliae TaxID=79967 RepID=A0ABY5XCL5_ERWPY|nr:TonB-dependent hemoglobin/transferrin/lactoferrin family receptor [Erwinia pyrifoliae]AUX72687.1 TonB-dependent hemoglobin/transferrin/lactoferrin family receptor [Erwinia pyrifoliae]MCA8877050.1 TonB-dependent hemoglobin/transferrin/lactoferrin family receptor [Erwinia pyrifoliae]UWS35144.1 TonB-dependent hemoglobin/transferrin/lactoferrin family receptor [Erwinia pyrifoliae]UXK14045.1 TonB-dependent hemoglobin/transferrin/lactoferrin family receptor [Erwinia pyrifoliae]CAX55609.1 TonB-dep
MSNFSYRQGIFHRSLMMGTLFGVAVTTTSSAAQPSGALAENRSGQQQILFAMPEDNALMTVLSPPVMQAAGSTESISVADMQRRGANDFGSIMRYQPLVGAVGSSSGSGSGKSGFDRAGYAGYNIRGLESNRVALSVDGIPQPDATGRGYGSRSGVNTVGIGRDYIDPYLYARVDIEAGATATSRANTAMGGSVSFLPKSADDYLLPDKQSYFGYQSDYDSANRSWHNGITAAAGDRNLRGLIAYSRRDGQQTRNNSDVLDAYPANWHSDAVLTSAIWQPDEQHKLAATLDFYSKVNHSRYASWTDRFKEPLGDADQQSNTRRWGITLKDEWTPDIDWIDSLSNKIYLQQTQAHDNTLSPQESPSTGYLRTYSDYNVKTWGYEAQLAKTLGRHAFLAGVNARLIDTERPFSQSPAQSVTKPQADSRTLTLGAFLQDSLQFDIAGHGFAVVPGVRVAHQETKPQNLANMATGTDVLTPEDAQKLYGKTSTDSQLLPSISLNYEVTPGLMTYLQYRRGVQFPNASQLYGSWNLGSNYIPGAQYALIGNTDLNTETSNNVEWGIKGQVNEGVTLNASLFYNTYKNFIAYTRYSRARSPDRFANVPANIATIFQAENRDNAYLWGSEISTKINYGTWLKEVNGLNTTFALGYSQGKSKSSYSGDKYVDLDSVAPMKAIIGMGWDDPAQRYGAAVTATFVKGKQADATNREAWLNNGSDLTDSSSEYTRVPGYGVVDLSAWVKVSKQVKLNGGIYNLTDRKYRDYLSSRTLSGQTTRDMNDRALAVMPGRNFQLGVNVDF